MTINPTWLVCGLLGINLDVTECERDCMRSLAREEAGRGWPARRRRGGDRESDVDRWIVTQASRSGDWARYKGAA